MKETVVFFGTPDIAAETLNEIIQQDYNVSTVISRPDRKKGRGMAIEETPVKQAAQKHNIPVLQPENLNDPDFLNQLKTLNAAYFVVIAYGKILSREILDIPEIACLNIHYSLLPRYRGASPIQFSLINGDEETGVCIIKMDEGMDSGDVLTTKKINISPQETIKILTQKLTRLGIESVMEVMSNYNNCVPVKQNHLAATYTEKITSEMSRINWQESSVRIYNLFRALNGSPGTYFKQNNTRIKLIAVKLPAEKPKNDLPEIKPGTLIRVNHEEVEVQCGSGSIIISELKPENKRDMPVKDFLNGHPLKPGDLLE